MQLPTGALSTGSLFTARGSKAMLSRVRRHQVGTEYKSVSLLRPVFAVSEGTAFVVVLIRRTSCLIIKFW
jgi:hypothetical protein